MINLLLVSVIMYECLNEFCTMDRNAVSDNRHSGHNTTAKGIRASKSFRAIQD